MSDWSIAVVVLATLGTSFLSGIFGMVGGAILIGILLAVLPVPAAMTLHAVAQMTANGQRAVLWRPHILWRALLGYLLGAGIMFAFLALVRFSPPKPWIYLCLGVLPYIALLVPKRHVPDIRRRGAPLSSGLLVMAMMVLAGVPGVMLDMFFQARSIDRRVIIATKAAMQTAGNVAKSAYFSLIVVTQTGNDTDGFSTPIDLPLWLIAMTAAMAISGTFLAKPVLHRFSDSTFHDWSQRLILAVGAVYLVKGIFGLIR